MFAAPGHQRYLMSQLQHSSIQVYLHLHKYRQAAFTLFLDLMIILNTILCCSDGCALCCNDGCALSNLNCKTLLTRNKTFPLAGSSTKTLFLLTFRVSKSAVKCRSCLFACISLCHWLQDKRITVCGIRALHGSACIKAASCWLQGCCVVLSL